ncbi:hypothetical protein F4860DRAFT_523771, partial [Xylaria cubensis]
LLLLLCYLPTVTPSLLARPDLLSVSVSVSVQCAVKIQGDPLHMPTRGKRPANYTNFTPFHLFPCGGIEATLARGRTTTTTTTTTDKAIETRPRSRHKPTVKPTPRLQAGTQCELSQPTVALHRRSFHALLSSGPLRADTNRVSRFIISLSLLH